MVKLEQLVGTAQNAPGSGSPAPRLHVRVASLENELRFAIQSIEALAAELKELKLKSQEQKVEFHPREELAVSQSTTGQYGAVAQRIVSHVQSKKEAFYPAQISRELDIPDCYVGKVLKDLEKKGMVRSLDNHGYTGRKLYMVNSPCNT